jgi:hypothetical protein
MLFTYILTGWEGSAADSRVWADAVAKKGFQRRKDSIILQMQDSLIAKTLLFLFVVFVIIFRSGELQVFGMCFVMYFIFSINPNIII